jgi:hypothetical protein
MHREENEEDEEEEEKEEEKKERERERESARRLDGSEARTFPPTRDFKGSTRHSLDIIKL